MPSSVLVKQPTFDHLLGPGLNWHGFTRRPWTGAIAGLQQHPMAKIFGTHEEPQYQSIKWSIETMGQRDHILVFDHRVIDGWHKYCACLELEIKPEIFELVCDEREALRFVLEHLLKTRPVSPAARSVGQAFRRDAAYVAHHGGKRLAGTTLVSTVELRSKAAGVSASTQQKVELVCDRCPDLIWQIVDQSLSPHAAYRRCTGALERAKPKGCRCASCANPGCEVHSRVRFLEERLRSAGLPAD